MVLARFTRAPSSVSVGFRGRRELGRNANASVSSSSTRSVFTSRSIIAVVHARVVGHRNFDTIGSWPELRPFVEREKDDEQFDQVERLVDGLSKNGVACAVRKQEHRPSHSASNSTRRNTVSPATTIGAFEKVALSSSTSYKVRASSFRVFNVMCAWEALPLEEDRDRIAIAFDRLKDEAAPGSSPRPVPVRFPGPARHIRRRRRRSRVRGVLDAFLSSDQDGGRRCRTSHPHRVSRRRDPPVHRRV